VDANGDIIATAKMEGDKYVFENLPLNQSYLFLLDVKDNIYPEKMDIYVRNNNKEEKITAKLNANGYYEFRYLKQQEVVLKEKENKDLQVVILQKEEEEVLKKAFDNLEFETGKAIIRNVSYASLEELAELMIKKDKWKIKISGHTDNVGNPASNLQLSKKRAEAVKAFLMSRGVTEDRIFVLYFGQTKPIADNKTEEGRQKNRRVEMQILE
jgi:outer membrane protein OmpA-like peptidoglycan-associated protein